MTENQIETPTQDIISPTEEHFVPQSKVNALVGGEKKKAYENGYKSAMAEIQANQMHAQNIQQPSLSVDDVKKIAQEEAVNTAKARDDALQQHQTEEHGKRVVKEIVDKLTQAHTAIPDFHEITRDIGFENMPDVLTAANTVDNTGHVLYELAKEPIKLAALRNVGPLEQVKLIKKLSESIKNNDAAAAEKPVLPPIGQVYSSSVNRGDNKMTSMSIADFKNNPNLRG